MIDLEDLEDRKKINFQKYQLPRFGFWYVWKLLLYIGMLIILLYFMRNHIKKHAEMEQLKEHNIPHKTIQIETE
jgi:hypothetical protein